MELKNQVAIKCRGIILHEGKLFIVKHSKDALFWALPGGHLEWPENPKECLERETVEELGIKPEIGKLLYVNSYERKDGVNFLEFFFEIKNSADFLDIGKLNGTHKDELFDILWVGKERDIKILPEKVFQDFKDGTLLSSEVQFIK